MARHSACLVKGVQLGARQSLASHRMAGSQSKEGWEPMGVACESERQGNELQNVWHP